MLDDASGSISATKTEDIPSAAGDTVDQLHHILKAVESRLKGLDVERVVVRRADFSKQQGKTEGPRLRLLAEGAATAAARVAVTDTRLGTGKEVAQWCSTRKEDLDEEARQLLAGANEHAKYEEAAAAALCALRV